jgi:hypothetical protein
MRRTKIELGQSCWANIVKISAAAVLMMACAPTRAVAQEKGQKTFSSAEAASQALVKAAESNDEKAMLEVLGPNGKDIVSSGDPVEDKQNRENFARRFEQMHRLVREPDGTTTLYIGAENWPAPIPLVSKSNVWYFDTEAGKKEILYRRVGRNEIWTIRVCEELVKAQKEYFAAQHEYAQKIFSDDEQKNGLYWKAAPGEAQSPMGPMVAAAVTQGYAAHKDSVPTPYHGYLYHTLLAQGKSAPGGAKSYISSGKMTDGFAFVAYPAVYRSSGVMTFIVGSDGVVYEKDLGKKTETEAKAMKSFNPDSSWHKAENVQEATNAETKK